MYSNTHSISPYFPVFSPRIATFFLYSAIFYVLLVSPKIYALHGSSRRSCSIEICDLKNFTKLTEKHMCQSLFKKIKP